MVQGNGLGLKRILECTSEKRTALAGLILMMGGLAGFLYLIFGNCTIELLPYGVCYAYVFNKLWFVFYPLIVSVVGFVVIVAGRFLIAEEHSRNLPN